MLIYPHIFHVTFKFLQSNIFPLAEVHILLAEEHFPPGRGTFPLLQSNISPLAEEHFPSCRGTFPLLQSNRWLIPSPARAARSCFIVDTTSIPLTLCTALIL